MHLGDFEYDAVIFDCDGVLADSEPAWALAEADLCAAFRVAYTPEVAALTTGAGLEEAVALMLASAGDGVDLPRANDLMRDLANSLVPQSVQEIADARQCAMRLGSLVPVGVASNTEQPLLDRVLEGIGLAGVLQTVVSASDVAAPKPAPDVYLLAAERLEVRPGRAIVVEDSPTGAAAARAAGCLVVGFGENAPDADFVAPDHQALLKLLAGTDSF